MSEYRYLVLHKALVLTVNLLVLVALTIAMYMAAQNPEEFTLEFLKFFGLFLVPALVFGVWGKRRLRRQLESLPMDLA
ncbi:hypothetical protein MASR1M90_03700 [Desulfovibrionales bacterium]